MKEVNYNFIKNKKFIYCLIVIITLYFYYKVRKDEDFIENLKDNKENNFQLENDIHLNNSKLLNIKIDKEKIDKLILSEIEKESNKDNYQDKFELWKIETFFITVFCAIYGGLYYYSHQQEKNNEKTNNSEDKIYLYDDYTNYLLDEAEFEFLINKE